MLMECDDDIFRDGLASVQMKSVDHSQVCHVVGGLTCCVLPAAINFAEILSCQPKQKPAHPSRRRSCRYWFSDTIPRLYHLQGHAVFAVSANICVTYQVMSILFEVESLRVENPRNILQVRPEPFKFEAPPQRSRTMWPTLSALFQALPSWLASPIVLLLADVIHEHKAHKSCGALQWHTQVQP